MSQPLFNDAKAPTAREDLELVVRTALARVLERPVASILPESQLENDLGLDSLGLIHVAVSIEEQFHVPILDGESPGFTLRTVADLAAFVSYKAGKTSSGREDDYASHASR